MRPQASTSFVYEFLGFGRVSDKMMYFEIAMKANESEPSKSILSAGKECMWSSSTLQWQPWTMLNKYCVDNITPSQSSPFCSAGQTLP